MAAAAAALPPGSRHSGCRPVAGTADALRVLAACLRAARPARRRCDWPRSTEPKGSSASRGLFDDMLPAASCIHSTWYCRTGLQQRRSARRGCGAVQGAAVQHQCSDCSHCSSTSSVVGRQAGRRRDRESGLLHAIAIWRCPQRRNVNLNHAAHGTRHTVRSTVFGTVGQGTRERRRPGARPSRIHSTQCWKSCPRASCIFCAPHDPTGLAWILYPSRRDGVPGSHVQR